MSAWSKVWPFRRSRADEDADRLLSAVTQVSRQPGFYGEGRTPDTLEGRFELMTLHAALVLIRLKGDPGLEPLSQAFTDQLFRQFDAGLREDGVGDTSVPKKMRKLAADFYGRLDAYARPIEAGDPAALAAALERNILGDGASFAPVLAAYAAEVTRRQAGAPVEDLMRLDGWAVAPG
jgi:cytochrome b pre-mRNA-processing protein 3